MASHVLIVDDEEGIRLSLKGILEDEEYVVSECASGEAALEFLIKEQPDIILLDVWLSGIDGLETLQKIKKMYADIPVIIISGHGNIQTAVQALQYGAHDFIEKPLSLDKVLLTVQHSLEMSNLRQENSLIRKSIFPDYEVRMVAHSPVMLAFADALYKVAPTSAWVLITGENGTGKELAACTLHRKSKLSQQPFIAINCAAIPEELIESELFGHEKGAFTGADSTRVGKFELAHGGTLFLDEIGDMSLKTQAKILRILQEESFERVGGSKTIKVQVRVVAATNKNLEEAIQRGEFRQDLYYRLCVFPLHIPPLRERSGDIPYLIDDLKRYVERKYSVKAPSFTPAAMKVLQAWTWPGNVRELTHLLERLTILYPDSTVDFHLLPAELLENIDDIEYTLSQVEADSTRPMLDNRDEYSDWHELLHMDYKQAKATFDRLYLEHKLAEVDGNVSKLAEIIGLERSNIYRKLRSAKP